MNVCKKPVRARDPTRPVMIVMLLAVGFVIATLTMQALSGRKAWHAELMAQQQAWDLTQAQAAAALPPAIRDAQRGSGPASGAVSTTAGTAVSASPSSGK